MTDQPKPDPQDGDGLLQRIASAWQITLTEPSESWDMQPPIDERYVQYVLTDAERSQLRATLTPQPTPEAAEGMGAKPDCTLSYQMHQYDGVYCTDDDCDIESGVRTPPKPAPDATAASIKDRIDRLTDALTGTDRPHDAATIHSLRKLLFIVRDLEKRTSSAPVPSPDGAGDPTFAYTQDCWKRAAAPAQVMPDLGPDWTPTNPAIEAMFADERQDWRADLHKRAADRDLERRTIAISPATGAAEPVAWQNIDCIIDALEAAGCCRNGQIISSEDHVANTIRNWLRSLSVQSSNK